MLLIAYVDYMATNDMTYFNQMCDWLFKSAFWSVVQSFFATWIYYEEAYKAYEEKKEAADAEVERGSGAIPETNPSVAWKRNVQNVNELDKNQFDNLKNNGIVSVNTSGSDRPLYSDPNSYYSTVNGEHVFIYDENGKLIYVLSRQRVKAFLIDTNPEGREFFRNYKVVGQVPDWLKRKFGWWSSVKI